MTGTAAAGGTDDAPTIELYTMGTGELLWEKFGHAALCVIYENPRRDRCYNYGATDFSKPVELGWGVLRGESVFWVSVTRPERMLDHYREYDRTIWRQVLPLSPAQARAAAESLRSDARGENKYYRYHHFHDNCSTRVRDIIDEATGHGLSRGATKPLGPSYRDYSRAGFAETTWLLALSDFVLGRRADVEPSEYDAMFLPWVLRDAVAERLGTPAEVIYQRQGRPFSTDEGEARLWLAHLILALGLPAFFTFVAGRFERLGLAVSAVPLVVLSLLLWAVAIISPLPELRYNEALLVLLPTDVLLFAGASARRRLYARGRVVMLLAMSLLLAVGVLRQGGLAEPILLALLPNLVASGLLSRVGAQKS